MSRSFVTTTQFRSLDFARVFLEKKHRRFYRVRNRQFQVDFVLGEFSRKDEGRVNYFV